MKYLPIKIIFPFLLILLLSSNSYSEEARSNETDLFIVFGKKVELNKQEVVNYLKGNLLFFKKLKSCARHKWSATNPVDGTRHIYEIKGKAGTTCVLSLRELGMKASCYLNKKAVNRLLTRVEYLRRYQKFEGWSESEQKVLADNCKFDFSGVNVLTTQYELKPGEESKYIDTKGLK